MNRLKAVVALLVAAFVARGATNGSGVSNRTGAESRRDPVEAMSAALQERQPTKALLGKINAIWKALPEPHKGNLKNDIVSLTCSGFLVLGDMDSFGKARSAIADMPAFLNETTERCAECGGTGRVRTRCGACGGTGRCSRCQGRGSISAPRLAGMGAAASMSCSSCHGSGRCAECNNGTKETRHSVCNGSGKRISKDKCQKAFEAHRSRAEAYLVGTGNNPVSEANRKGPELSKADSFHPETKPTPQRDAMSLSELQNRVEVLSHPPFVVEDIIDVCEALLDTQPSEEIKEALRHCSPILKPFRSARLTKDVGKWRSELQELLEVVRAIKTAREAAMPDDQDIVFDYRKYVREYCHPNCTTIRKEKLFQSFWSKAFASNIYREGIKVSFFPVPKGMKFVVDNVSAKETEDGIPVYSVSVTPLEYGKKNHALNQKWNGDPKQTQTFVTLVKHTGGYGSELLISADSTAEPENWSRGTILEADNWLILWLLADKPNIDIVSGVYMFRSVDELLDLEDLP